MCFCFQVFQLGEQQLISRAWLLDPAETPQPTAVAKPGTPSEPWNGEFYCSFGHGPSRSWPEARQFGFICGGGGSWYSNSLKVLSPGDRIWVNVPGAGYVGVARNYQPCHPAIEFRIPIKAPRCRRWNCSAALIITVTWPMTRSVVRYFVSVEWLFSLPLNEAIKSACSATRTPSAQPPRVALDGGPIERTLRRESLIRELL